MIWYKLRWPAIKFDKFQPPWKIINILCAWLYEPCQVLWRILPLYLGLLSNKIFTTLQSSAMDRGRAVPRAEMFAHPVVEKVTIWTTKGPSHDKWIQQTGTGENRLRLFSFMTNGTFDSTGLRIITLPLLSYSFTTQQEELTGSKKILPLYILPSPAQLMI